MVLDTLLRKFRSSRPLLVTGIIMTLIAALFGGAFLPASAATMPVITPVSVVGGMVQLRISNLPASTEFAVTMGPVGSQGIGHLIAHFTTGNAGTYTYWFEILSDVLHDAQVDVRIDSGNGYVAWTTFNTGATVAATAVPTVAATVAPTPVYGSGGAVTATSSVRVVHVEQGGIVRVEVRNLPVNVVFNVTIGKAGSQGIGGSLVAHLNSGSTTGYVAIATFEIPVNVRTETSLDLRLEGSGYVYVVTFSNTTF